MTGVVGYYVHHVGSGHRYRAQVLAARLAHDGIAVTGLSSLPRPSSWTGEWVRLPPDDGHPRDVAAWLEAARPELVVVDVSDEVLLLARLHGIPAVAVVLPGRRDDPAHLLGLGVAEALVGFWPRAARGMTPGLPDDLAGRLVPLGALSRHPVRPVLRRPPHDGERNVTLLLGSGGHDVGAENVRTAQRATPDWRWTVLGAGPGTWVEDPSAALAGADVVVTHAGQNALAEIAAARRPAVVLPQARPHDEQRATGAVLADGWPAVVRSAWPDAAEWTGLLDRAASLDPRRWTEWCDGWAADRFADVVLTTRARVLDGGVP